MKNRDKKKWTKGMSMGWWKTSKFGSLQYLMRCTYGQVKFAKRCYPDAYAEMPDWVK